VAFVTVMLVKVEGGIEEVREELLLGFGGEVECCVIDVAVR
jgi:hypothetical protein